MLEELEGGGGGSGRKIKRETDREGGREKGIEREIEEEGRTCSHIHVRICIYNVQLTYYPN